MNSLVVVEIEGDIKMRRFKVEHKNWEKPPIVVTLNQPPYEDENILYKTSWKIEDVTITDVTPKFEEEE